MSIARIFPSRNTTLTPMLATTHVAYQLNLFKYFTFDAIQAYFNYFKPTLGYWTVKDRPDHLFAQGIVLFQSQQNLVKTKFDGCTSQKALDKAFIDQNAQAVHISIGLHFI